MLGEEFQRGGNEVRMFTFERQYPKLLFPGGKQTASFTDMPQIPVERVFTPYLPQTWKKAVASIKEYQPDLLIASYFLPWFAPSYAWICRQLPETRRICLAHNIAFHEKWPGADFLSKAFFKHCEGIVVLSEACYKDLQKMPPQIASKGLQGFHPIYDCYQESDPPKLEQQAGPTALFFGLIKPYKGLDILLKALKQARMKIPGLKLIVAGEVYGKQETYLNLIRQLGLTEAVETHFRYINGSEIGAFFRRSQRCVLPYKSATQSGVTATSYSFNIPVLASDVGGLGEYISPGETGLLVPPNDPEALAGAMIDFFERDLFACMSAAIPAFKERFSWDKLAAIILDA